MASYGAMLLRLILGVVYIMHAYLALVVFGPSGMIAYQVKAGIPFPEIATWYLILAHGLGGIFLVLGIYTALGGAGERPRHAGRDRLRAPEERLLGPPERRLRVRAGAAGGHPGVRHDRRGRAQPEAASATRPTARASGKVFTGTVLSAWLQASRSACRP